MKMRFRDWIQWKWQQTKCYFGFHASADDMWMEVDDDGKGGTSEIWTSSRCIHCAKKMI